MGRRTQRKLLQPNNNDPRPVVLGIRLEKKHNASNRASIQRVNISRYVPQHHATLQLSQRRPHLYLQEAVGPVNPGADSQSRELRRLRSLVLARASGHMERASFCQVFLSVIGREL